MKKEVSTVIILFILLSVIGTPVSGIETSVNLSYQNSDLESEEVENMSITGNEELEDFAQKHNLTGNGSKENPFLLENYTINSMGENHSIYLKSTDLYFVIRDCKIFNSSETGIKINRVSNFTLENSVVKNSTTGISIESTENITIKGSEIYNTGEGIYLKDSHNNTITNNNISNNNDFGVRISESNHNLIYHNIFFENGIQARDNGDNQWDKGKRGGNYWSDYEEKYSDANESINKGIWDTVYEIRDNNSDRFPLISPVGPPTNFRVQPVRDEYVNLTWDKPLYSIRYPVEEIILYRGKEVNNLSVYKRLNSTVQVFHDENVTEEKRYYYALNASNEKYVSVMSEIRTVEIDSTNPMVENYYPKEDEDVPIDATVEVEFSEEMEKDSIYISVKDEEGEEIDGDLDGEGTEFYFDPSENLSYGTTYKVSVNGSDRALNWFESPFTWRFTTVTDTGIIKGRVVDEKGEPLENVNVYVDEEHQTFTNSFGEFQIEVPSGNITLKISKEGYKDEERKVHIEQGEEIEVEEDIILKEQEGIISRWFWPLALVGGGTLLLGIIALVIFFYRREEEPPPLDEDIYDVEYEDVDPEEFESWWEDEDSS